MVCIETDCYMVHQICNRMVFGGSSEGTCRVLTMHQQGNGTAIGAYSMCIRWVLYRYWKNMRKVLDMHSTGTRLVPDEHSRCIIWVWSGHWTGT